MFRQDWYLQKEVARAVAPAGPWLALQIRLAINHTSASYVTTRYRERARLEFCPLHPEGGCGLSRHGTYERYTPYGPALIVRYYCREGRTTVSLLPDCFAARLTGTLADLAREVRTAELEGVEEAAQSGSPNPHIDRATRIARVKRRQELLYRSLGAIRGFLPDRFAGCLLQLVPMEAAVGAPFVLLLLLRCWCADSLSVLPPPIGFRPPEVRSPDPDGGHQQLKPRDSPALAS